MHLLPSKLYESCRKTLCRCREFEDFQILRSLFITEELAPFRIGLRRADTPAKLVDLFLEDLVSMKLRSSKPVLLAFMATLIQRYEHGDALRCDLEDLYLALQEELSSSVLPAYQNADNLFKRLLKLNFRSQMKLFAEIINQHRIASFLIHGPNEHGQSMLAHRLTHFKPEWETCQQIVIDAGSSGIGKSSRALWGQIARRLNLPSDANQAILSETITQWWETQDVIITIRTVNYIPPELLKTWLKEFWMPIVWTARKKAHLTRRHTYLLLILVDYEGSVIQSDFLLAKNYNSMDFGLYPLALPPAAPFLEAELEYWLTDALELGTTGLSASMLTKSPIQGIPELVYEQICTHCGTNWYGEVAKCY
jgi:hypothetical protein